MPKSTTTEATTAAPQSTTNNTETEANNTQTTTPTVAKPTTAATEKTPLTMNLEFYSLYMHLRAYEDYQPAQEQEDQKDEDKPKRLKVTTNALLIRDKQRDEKDCTVIGKVLKGTIIEVLETKESSNGAFTDVKAKLISGEFKDRATGKKLDITTAWVPTRQNNQNFTEQTTEDASKASKEKTRPSYWQGMVTATPTNKAAGGDGLIIWKKYEAGKLTEKVGGLNAKSRFTFDSRQVVLTSDNKMIAECTAVGKLGFKGDGKDIDKFWTTVDSGSIIREKVEPTLFNTVVPCNIKIKAGETLGYLGTYETPTATGEIANKKQVHVEIFTPNLTTVQFLLNNPFKLTGRKYIKIPKNTLLKGELPIETAIKWDEVLKTKLPTFPGIPSEPEEKDYGFGDLFGLNTNASKPTTSPLRNPTTANTDIKTTQPTENKTTETTNDSTKQSEAAQETIPDYTTSQDHYFATDKLQTIKPTRVTNAGKDVKITSGEDEYYQIAVEKHTGYIKKQGLEEIDQHEWAKLGFQLVQEANTNSDGYLDPDLMPAVFQQIYSKIDTNKDGKLQPEELKIALQNEEIRDQWSKLITYHPSEWKTDTRPLLARFTQLLTNPLAPEEAQTKAQALLAHETARMNTLTFLEQIVPPIPPMLYHFHPVAFVEYLQIQSAQLSQSVARNFTITDAKEALRVIYDRHGKDMATIVERMYRDETAHFKSKQYINTGTGGMEVFGSAPYYGWDSNLFTKTPIGTWSSFENKGMSGQGGNAQVTDKKKVFIVFPTVLSAMEFKVAYINKYNGNYARWHSVNITVQENYKKALQGIIPRFINEFEAEKK